MTYSLQVKTNGEWQDIHSHGGDDAELAAKNHLQDNDEHPPEIEIAQLMMEYYFKGFVNAWKCAASHPNPSEFLPDNAEQIFRVKYFHGDSSGETTIYSPEFKG